MLERFTDHAKQVMNLARKEVLETTHDTLDAEHMLLGLLRMPSTIAVQALTRLEVVPDELAGTVRASLPRRSGPQQVGTGQVIFTEQAKRVLEKAIEEAGGFGSSELNTGHLLVAIARVEDSNASRALRAAGVSPERVREVAEGLSES